MAIYHRFHMVQCSANLFINSKAVICFTRLHLQDIESSRICEISIAAPDRK